MANEVVGFVNPEWLILMAVAAIGIALALPILEPLWDGTPITYWHWAGLGVGSALIAACVAWFVRAS